MKVQEIKKVILDSTELSVTKAHQKALRVVSGQITLESVTGAAYKSNIAKQQKIYIPRGYYYVLGKEEATITRKVADISSHNGTIYGRIKVNKKLMTVTQTSDGSWIIA